MAIRTEMTARKISVIAICLWFTSLLFPAFSLYSGQKYFGFETLAMGWLSPIIGNFAWYANVFFLYAFMRLVLGKTATLSSVLAGIVSLDTIRYTDILLNEAGHKAPIYGYGHGAILWFLSISLIIAAAGMRRKEEDQNSNRIAGLVPGLILFAIILGTSTYFAIHDRAIANLSEKTRLKGIAFKRYEVCSVPDPVITEPVKNFSGVLEVILPKERSSRVYPFDQIPDLLRWGIPVVRINGRDYSINRYSYTNELQSVPAEGKASSILYVNEERTKKNLHKSISTKLIDTSNKVVFEQVWEKEQLPNTNSHYYCPDYKSSPDVVEQPRRFLVDALNLIEINKNQRDDIKRENINGSIIQIAEGGLSTNRLVHQWKVNHPGQTIPRSESLGTNCPEHIGWGQRNSRMFMHARSPFMVKEKAYYLSSENLYSCSEDYVYLYIGRDRKGKYMIDIQKRKIQDFEPIWNRIITIDNAYGLSYNKIRIESINEKNDVFSFKLINANTGEFLIVNAPTDDFQTIN